jgi:hypothetical protein
MQSLGKYDTMIRPIKFQSDSKPVSIRYIHWFSLRMDPAPEALKIFRDEITDESGGTSTLIQTECLSCPHEMNVYLMMNVTLTNKNMQQSNIIDVTRKGTGQTVVFNIGGLRCFNGSSAILSFYAVNEGWVCADLENIPRF